MIYKEFWWGLRKRFMVMFPVLLGPALLFAALTPNEEGSTAYGDCAGWGIRSEPLAERRALFLYINGVDTPPLREYDAICNLGHAVRSIGVQPRFAANPTVLVSSFKNRTQLEELLDQDRAATPRVIAAVWVSAQAVPPPADILEAKRQVRNLGGRFSAAAANPDSRKLADMIRADVTDGRRVVLVPHSQGNLLVHEALRLLAAEAGPVPASALLSCIGVVALASPTSAALPEGVAAASVWVRGDVIYGPLVAPWTGVSPPEEAIVTTSLSTPKGREFRLSSVKTNVAIHDVNASYFGHAESRARIVAHLGRMYRTLAGRTCRPVPEPEIEGTWRGTLGPLGDGALRLTVRNDSVAGVWMGSEPGARPVPVEFDVLSRRALRLVAPGASTPIGLYLIGQVGSAGELQVTEDEGDPSGSLFRRD